jgi:hypothetical protein
LCAPDTAAAFGAAEEFLVGQARSMRWVDFAKACGYWLRQARRDADPDPDKSDRDHRCVSLYDGLRGTGLLSGELTPTAKAEVGAELERLERQLFEADWAAAKAVHGEAVTVADLARTPAPRRHDALVDVARRSATAPADGKRPKPLLSVLVGEDAFRNILEVADGTLVSPATAADLLDEAVIEAMLFEGPSRVLDLGHQRSFVGAARRALEVVHRTCTGQGCHIRSDRCEIDHILPWTDGGPTRPDNGRPPMPPPPPPTHQTIHGLARTSARTRAQRAPRRTRPPRARPGPHPRPPAPRPRLGRPRRCTRPGVTSAVSSPRPARRACRAAAASAVKASTTAARPPGRSGG